MLIVEYKRIDEELGYRVTSADMILLINHKPEGTSLGTFPGSMIISASFVLRLWEKSENETCLCTIDTRTHDMY